MGTGISTIWKANGRGGVRIVRGREHVAGILSAALGNCESRNPFQSLGLGEDFIFDPDDPTVLNDIRESVESIIERLEGYELLTLQRRPDNLSLRRTAQGEYAMPIYIIDAEEDDEYALEITGLQSGVLVVR